MAGSIHLTVVTPERSLIDESVDEVQVPGLGGYLGVLPGHAALFSELQTGILSYMRGGKTERLALSRGFIEVLNDDVRVLADIAETGSSIDVERARKSKARAEERISSGSDDVDYGRARESLDRADTRLAVAGKTG